MLLENSLAYLEVNPCHPIVLAHKSRSSFQITSTPIEVVYKWNWGQGKWQKYLVSNGCHIYSNQDCRCDHICKIIASALSERNCVSVLYALPGTCACSRNVWAENIEWTWSLPVAATRWRWEFPLHYKDKLQLALSILWIPVNVLSCTHITEARKFAATAMNDRSSRSHTIYRLTLESKEIGGDMVKVSVLVSLPMASLCIWWMLVSCHVSTVKPV